MQLDCNCTSIAPFRLPGPTTLLRVSLPPRPPGPPPKSLLVPRVISGLFRRSSPGTASKIYWAWVFPLQTAYSQTPGQVNSRCTATRLGSVASEPRKLIGQHSCFGRSLTSRAREHKRGKNKTPVNTKVHSGGQASVVVA
jgi:hypothetical protein